MNCELCKIKPSECSAVLGGVYYKHLCRDCKAGAAANRVSSGHARWARGIDMEDHEADVQQPYNADGTPNARFIKLYPRQARAVFTEAQMRLAQ